MTLRRTLLGLLVATAALPALAAAQDGDENTRYVISIGHHGRVDGLRLNFRDREFDRVRGANITIWQPYRNANLGRVGGLVLGLPMGDAGELRGLGFGIAGVQVNDDSRGILVGGIGVGAGGELTGINIGGIGAAAGDGVTGLTVGGIGVGSGGDLRGISLGGIGAGAGGDVRGLAAGGIGVGAGGNVRGIIAGGIGAAAGGNLRGAAFGGIGVGAGSDAHGILAGGVGVGAGGNVTGTALGGIGVGAGGDVRGLAVGGIGVGAGGQVRGIAVGGLGVGAGEMIYGAAIGALGVGSPRIEGFAVGSLVRAAETKAIIIAPVLFRSLRDADVRGATISSVNIVYGRQRGLALGLVNYTESLNGIQVGVVNVVRENPNGRRVLPIINWGRGR